MQHEKNIYIIIKQSELKVIACNDFTIHSLERYFETQI